MHLTFVTGNPQKFEEASAVLAGIDLAWERIDLPEIQGNREEVVRAKALAAYDALHKPLFVEDVSVCFPALNGLPGPFVKFFLKELGHDGLQQLVHKYADHRAEAICTIGLMLPGFTEAQLFEGSIWGQIVPSRGQLKHGVYSWNSIFQPEGSDKTMGEMSMAEHGQSSHRRKALDKLQAFLSHERA